MEQTKQGARAKLPMLEVLIFSIQTYIYIYFFRCIRATVWLHKRESACFTKFAVGKWKMGWMECQGMGCERLVGVQGGGWRVEQVENEKQVPSFRQVECICICALAANKRITS